MIIILIFVFLRMENVQIAKAYISDWGKELENSATLIPLFCGFSIQEFWDAKAIVKNVNFFILSALEALLLNMDKKNTNFKQLAQEFLIRNEKVFIFKIGDMVGAMCLGREVDELITTGWDGTIKTWRYDQQHVKMREIDVRTNLTIPGNLSSKLFCLLIFFVELPFWSTRWVDAYLGSR